MTEQEKLEFINTTCNRVYKTIDEVDLYAISVYSNLSEDFIREFSDKVNWYNISRYQKLSENFICEFADKVEWYYISEYQKLSEDFIIKFQDNMAWVSISSHALSEDFIREFQNFVDWETISIYQNLSENFIREFKDKVDWEFISKHQKLSKNFIREFKDELYTDLIEDNWIYKNTEFLKQQVINTNLYKCYENYFIAYKGIRSDRYSNFNFQYQYLPNQTYESWCDCSNKENSFGLSVWTEEEAYNYCNELVVKVKVNYEDVGRVIHDGGKIRCRKITILN